MCHVISSLYSNVKLRQVLKKIMSGQVTSLAFFISVLCCGCVDFTAYAKKSHLVISGDLHSLATEQTDCGFWLSFDCDRMPQPWPS